MCGTPAQDDLPEWVLETKVSLPTETGPLIRGTQANGPWDADPRSISLRCTDGTELVNRFRETDRGPLGPARKRVPFNLGPRWEKRPSTHTPLPPDRADSGTWSEGQRSFTFVPFHEYQRVTRPDLKTCRLLTSLSYNPD